MYERLCFNSLLGSQVLFAVIFYLNIRCLMFLYTLNKVSSRAEPKLRMSLSVFITKIFSANTLLRFEVFVEG